MKDGQTYCACGSPWPCVRRRVQFLGYRYRWRVTLRFAWYDLWVGVYVDRVNRRLYVCPLPCVLVTIDRPLVPWS